MVLTSAPRCRSPGYHFPGALLPAKRVSHKVTLILDLDETLVHSSFKPVPGADWVVPVPSSPLVAPPRLTRCCACGMLRGLTPVLQLSAGRGAPWQRHATTCGGAAVRPCLAVVALSLRLATGIA